MKTSKHLYLLVFGLIFLGYCSYYYKCHYLNFPVAPNTKTLFWDMEIKLDFLAKNKPVKLALNIPRSSNQYLIKNEVFFSGQYGVTQFANGFNREAVWTRRSVDGPQTVLYQALIHPIAILGREEFILEPSMPVLPFNGQQRSIGHFLIEEIRKVSADTESFVAQLLKSISSSTDRMDDFHLLMPKTQGSIQKNQLLLAYYLLNLADVPSNIVHGVDLQEGSNRPIKSWLQVFTRNGDWQLFDIAIAAPVDKTQAVIIWQGEDDVIARLDGGKGLSVNITVQPQYISPMDYVNTSQEQHWMIQYSFFKLPLASQNIYMLLLTIPIGVLLLIFLRNFIGFKTFGTFMPILIAISFRETQLVAGITLFVLITSLGLLTRFYLEKLQLLMVPRLGAVMIVVLLLMSIISLFSYKLGLPIGLSLALFPIVIIVMTIERMTVVWEERGASEAIQQGLGTLLVATACYWLMNIEFIKYLFFVFPELLLVVLGVTILTGRYTGYRLTELIRFRELARS